MLPFHLCQPGEGASCGACCGLYNFRDHSRAAVQQALTRHTERIRRTELTPDAFRAAAEALKREERAPAFPDVRVCPLLGFIDAAQTRVGCLAHPKVTGGVDLRDCGVYSADLCETFECPSFLWLTAGQARLVRAACPDWYLYGLVVTDVEFVRGCLRLLADRLGETPDLERLCARPESVQAAHRLFALKETAPDRAGDDAVFGRFSAAADGEPRLRQIDYARLGAKAAPEDDVVLCLGYAPDSLPALERARQVVRAAVDALAQTCSAN